MGDNPAQQVNGNDRREMTENYKMRDRNKSFTLILQYKNQVVTNEVSKLKTKKWKLLFTKEARSLQDPHCWVPAEV